MLSAEALRERVLLFAELLGEAVADFVEEGALVGQVLGPVGRHDLKDRLDCLR